MMGGVHTDIDGATPLAGLYAAGETACVSINGANRLGSNSLPECLVFGARAGRAAAEYAASAPGAAGRHRGPGGRRGAPDRARPAGHHAAATTGSPRSATEMQETMEESAGIYRNGPDDDRRASTRCASCRSGCRGSGSATPAAPSTPS